MSELIVAALHLAYSMVISGKRSSRMRSGPLPLVRLCCFSVGISITFAQFWQWQSANCCLGEVDSSSHTHLG